MIGTFVIVPTHLTSGGTPFDNSGALFPPYASWFCDAATYASVLEAMQDIENSDDFILYAGVHDLASPISFTDTVRLQANGACIYLDDAHTPIAFNNLPTNFTVTAASIKVSQNPLSPINRVIEGGGNADYWLQQGVGVDGTINTNEFDYTMPKTMLSIVNDGMGFKVSVSLAAGDSSASYVGPVYGIYIEGTYDSQPYQFDMEQPEEPVEPGTVITVTSSEEEDDPVDFNQITDIEVVYNDEDGEEVIIPIPIEYWIEWSLYFIIFELPPEAFIDLPPIFFIRMRSTQFSGSVNLGKFITIYFLNAPGIYRFVGGKTNDTLYDVTNGGTIDVKIPNPFIKSGYIGS